MNSRTAPRPGVPAKRARNAADTKAAILQAAITAFTQHGYDGVGVREIAQAAGVTAMLVNRYFGSKEGLFAQTVDAAFAPRTVVGEDPRTLSRATAETLVARTAPDAEHLDPFLLMLRSVPNPRAAEIVRAGIERHVGAHLAARLNGADTGERAELALALIAGTWLMRTVIGTDALREATPTLLTDQLQAMLDVVIDHRDEPTGSRVRRARTAPRA
jgi:AcrR family transcriptional regulator